MPTGVGTIIMIYNKDIPRKVIQSPAFYFTF